MNKRRLYFLKQKLIGVVILILTALFVWLMEGDATIAFLTVPMGLLMIFSKEMVLTDEYFFEENDREK